MVQQAIASAEIKRSFDQIRNEISDIRQLLASRRRDAEYSEFKCKLAALHFEKALNRYVHAYRKAGFNPGNRAFRPGIAKEGAGRVMGVVRIQALTRATFWVRLY